MMFLLGLAFWQIARLEKAGGAARGQVILTFAIAAFLMIRGFSMDMAGVFQ